MAISSVSSTTSTTTTSSASSSTSSSLVENYESFLTLLLKQLEVQDPTNPVDASEYTSQLVQLANLEQQIANGDKLDTMATAVNQMSFGYALGYMGQTVEASGDTTALQDGSAKWEYDLDSTAAKTTLTVTDEDGNTVFTTTGDTGSGTHEFTWDGTGSDGTKHTSGNFTLSVSATDSTGTAVTADIRMKGTVTGVDTSSGSTVLTVGGVTVALSDVQSVS